MDLDRKVVNTIRGLCADTVQKANSGHPGLPLGAAPMAYTLWSKVMNSTPKDVNWINRDRFILSGDMDQVYYIVYCIYLIME